MLKQVFPAVLLFKMSSGEEVIAQVKHKEGNHYMVTSPMAVVMGPNGLQLMPYLLLADSSEIAIPDTTITAKPKQSYEQEYLSLITGIQLPAKGNIIV